MAVRMNPQLNPAQLKKRVLLFYFAAGVNLLMAFWVASAGGSSQASGGTITIITLVFIGFGGLNYYMARKLQKYLRRLMQERGGVAPAEAQDATDKP